jgi:hypothetical protein
MLNQIQTQTPIKQFNAVNFRNKLTYNELEQTAEQTLKEFTPLNDNVIDKILSFSTLNRCYKCNRTDFKTFKSNTPFDGVICSRCDKIFCGGQQNPKARISGHNLRLQKEILLKDYQTYEFINYTIDEDDIYNYLLLETHQEEHLLNQLSTAIFKNDLEDYIDNYRIYPQEESIRLIKLIREELNDYNKGLIDCIFFNMIHNRGYDIDEITDDIKGRYYLFHRILISDLTQYQELTKLKTIGNINIDLYTIFKRVRNCIDIDFIKEQLTEDIYLYILDDLNITHLTANDKFSLRLYKDALYYLDIYEINELQAKGLEQYEEYGLTHKPAPHQLIISGLYHSIRSAVYDYFL